MKSILYSDTSWTFLKLNALAGVVTILGHCDIIALITLHLPMRSPCKFYSGGVKTTPK